MKKRVVIWGIVLAIIGVSLFAYKFANKKQSTDPPIGTQFDSISTPIAAINTIEPTPYTDYDGLAHEIAVKTMIAFESQNYKSLAEHIHPELGVVFAPYTFIDFEENIVFTSEQVQDFDNDRNVYNWGSHSISPISVELTVAEYIEQFVCDKNYLQSDQFAINNTIRNGNDMENFLDVFQNCFYVDFHNQGTEEYEFLDWSSVKIVMLKYEGTFKVVAVVRSCY